MKDGAISTVFLYVDARLLKTDELRLIIRQRGFSVKVLAAHVALDVRTLERRFSEQFRMTPKAWIMRERMSLAPPLLVAGLANKEVAASLKYSCESNFCRDFKRCYGSTPHKFAVRAHLFPQSRVLINNCRVLIDVPGCPDNMHGGLWNQAHRAKRVGQVGGPKTKRND